MRQTPESHYSKKAKYSNTCRPHKAILQVQKRHGKGMGIHRQHKQLRVGLLELKVLLARPKIHNCYRAY